MTTLFRSVVVFGKAEIMENEEKINSAMLSFGLKYNNDINAVKRKLSVNGADFAVLKSRLNI